MIVDGFARSGNTFLVSLLQCAFSDVQWGIEYPHRLSTVENHRDTLIVPIREPLGCLTSYLVLRRDHSHGGASSACAEYVQWMTAIKNSDAIVARFEEFTTQPARLLDRIGEAVGQIPRTVVPSVLWAGIRENATGDVAALDPHTGRVPRAYPDERKEVRDALIGHPALLAAQTAYASVVD